MAHLRGVILVLVLAAACGRHDNPNPDVNVEGTPAPGNDGTLTRADSALVLGPGDVKIANEDSSVDMALIGQKIVVKLSDKTMARVRQETDTANVQGTGLGASIEKMVKRTVASTLNQQMEYPLSEVKDARYENGRIVLERNDGKSAFLANTDINHRKLMESFRPEDAQRFVAAVNAKKGK